MVDLKKYVDKEVKKGYSYSQIKKKLLKSGYSKRAVDDAVNTHRLAPSGSKKKVAFHTTIIVVCVIVVVVAVSLVFTFQRVPVEQIKESVKLIETGTGLKPGLKAKVDACQDDVCVLKLAAEYDDTSFCSSVSNGFLRDVCANADWREEGCVFEGLIGEGDECWLSRAKDENNAVFCDRLFGKMRNDCLYDLAVFNSDFSFCLGNDACLYRYALEFKSADACREYADPEACFDELAVESGDSSLCSEGSFYCELKTIDSPEEQLEYAKKIDAQHEDIQFDVLSVSNSDYSLSVKRPDNRTTTILKGALLTGNPDICTLLDDVTYDFSSQLRQISIISACITRVAFELGNPSLCSKISLENERVICEDLVNNGCGAKYGEVCDLLS